MKEIKRLKVLTLIEEGRLTRVENARHSPIREWLIVQLYKFHSTFIVIGRRLHRIND